MLPGAQDPFENCGAQVFLIEDVGAGKVPKWRRVPAALAVLSTLVLVALLVTNSWRPKEVPKFPRNSIGMPMVPIKPGTFTMGSSQDAREMPRHTVRITAPFDLAEHEVTQGQYQMVMGVNPSNFEGSDDLPVENVSWFDALRFCNALSKKEGLKPFYEIDGDGGSAQVTAPDWNGEGYRLPTEAEWEYACRAGSSTKYYFGDDPAPFKQYAWFDKNADGKTHPVGVKKPNKWGLRDMHGNVWEWCWDRYDEGYYKTLTNLDPKGPNTGVARVLRGGGWSSGAAGLRTACRPGLSPSLRYVDVGLRFARTYH